MQTFAVIATHDRPELLQRTMQSIAEAKLPANFSRLFVVENASDSGARAICQAFAARLPVEYVHTPISGKCRALQMVVDRLESGLLIFFDDDIRLHPETLAAYARAAEVHGRRKLYGGPFGIDYDEGANPPSWLKTYLPPSAVGTLKNPYLYEADSPFMIGFNYAVFVEDIKEAGGFNLHIGPGALTAGSIGNPLGDEIDLYDRLMEIGCEKVWVKDAVVWHYVPKDRCTPPWALHRIYRSHIAMGADKEGLWQGRLRLGGIPLWFWRKYMALWVFEKLSYVAPDEELRFQMQRPMAKLRGLLAGRRLRQKRSVGVEKGLPQNPVCTTTDAKPDKPFQRTYGSTGEVKLTS